MRYATFKFSNHPNPQPEPNPSHKMNIHLKLPFPEPNLQLLPRNETQQENIETRRKKKD